MLPAWLLVGAVVWSAPLAAQETEVPSPAPTVASPGQGGTQRATRPDPVRPEAQPGKGIRTLDEITIEGEVAVPQVLFITARDRTRYEDRLYRRYLPGRLELARRVPLPEHIRIHFRTPWEETR